MNSGGSWSSTRWQQPLVVAPAVALHLSVEDAGHWPGLGGCEEVNAGPVLRLWLRLRAVMLPLLHSSVDMSSWLGQAGASSSSSTQIHDLKLLKKGNWFPMGCVFTVSSN